MLIFEIYSPGSALLISIPLSDYNTFDLLIPLPIDIIFFFIIVTEITQTSCAYLLLDV